MVHNDVEKFVEEHISAETPHDGWANPLDYYWSHFEESYPDTDADVGDLVVGLKQIIGAEIKWVHQGDSQKISVVGVEKAN